jgi:hypothetical protein
LLMGAYMKDNGCATPRKCRIQESEVRKKAGGFLS